MTMAIMMGVQRLADEFLLNRNIKTFLSYSNVGCRYFVKKINTLNFSKLFWLTLKH